MNLRVSLFTFALLGIAGIGGAEAHSDVTMAIVGNGADEPMVRVIEAKLSTLPGITIVEREEIRRLVSEKQLKEFAAGGQLAQGFSLLKADALLVAEKTDEGKQIALRLFSTHNSARVWSQELEKTDWEKWTDRLVETIGARVPKCLLLPEKALPVAVLNLRATTFSLANVELEARLTRLLEMRLDAEPGVVLLERRRLGDAHLERNLTAGFPEPLQSSVRLVEGSIDSDKSGRKLSLHLRVRSKSGSRETTIHSADGDLIRLTGEAAAFVTGAGESMEGFGAAEAQEYLAEALWAEKHGMDEMALTLGEAAIALGENSSKLRQMLARLYARLTIGEQRFYNGKYLKSSSLSLEARYGLAVNGLAMCRELAEEKQGAPRSEMLCAVAEFLRGLDANPSSTLDREKLRGLLRELAPFDPKNRGAYQLALTAKYASVLADSADEIFSFYEAVVDSSLPKRFWVFKYLLQKPEMIVPGRLGSLEETKKRLVILAEKWKAKPETEIFGWLLQSRHGSPENSASGYREYLKIIKDRGLELEQKSELEAYLESEYQDDGFRGNFLMERADLLACLLRMLQKYNRALLSEYFARGTFDPDMAQTVWGAFKEYRSRILESSTEAEKSDRVQSFNFFENAFLTRYPEAERSLPNPDPLTLEVTRYWCAGRPENLREFGSNSLEISGDDVWTIGSWNGQPGGSMVRISLPSLQDDQYPTSITGTGGKIAVAPDAVYVLHGKYPGSDQPMTDFLGRFDPKSGKWEERPFPDAYDVFSVGKKLYFNLWKPTGSGDENGLMEYDWASADSSLLFSSRRKPTLNQLDASLDARLQGVFEGPNNQVLSVFGPPLSRIFVVQEKAGDWNVAFEMSPWRCLTVDGSALLVGRKGEAVFVNSRSRDTWLDPAALGKWGWKKPTNWKSRWLAEGEVAFRSDELFILSRTENRRYQLLWYWKNGPAEGLVLPLIFKLPTGAKNTIEAISQSGNSCNFDVKAIAMPEKNNFTLRPFASRQGLIIKSPSHGFWFIPNSDLEAKKAEWAKGQKRELDAKPPHPVGS